MIFVLHSDTREVVDGCSRGDGEENVRIYIHNSAAAATLRDGENGTVGMQCWRIEERR